jgi:imidazole glycerol-phosphate synthase subunit HisF
MSRTRIIPALLLNDGGLVKTVKFSKERYVGDPINAVRIFNVKEVDELVLLDITRTRNGLGPAFDDISEIVSEAFMPVGYGGGITSLQQIDKLFQIGVDKVILNTAAFENEQIVYEASRIYGSQSIVVSIDVKKDLWGEHKIYTHSGTKKQKMDLLKAIKHLQELGAGEIILNSIDRDGTMQGYDLPLLRKVSHSLDVPVVAIGGAGSIDHFAEAIKEGASAVAAGSMFIFQGVHKAVLISYITTDQLDKLSK